MTLGAQKTTDHITMRISDSKVKAQDKREYTNHVFFWILLFVWSLAGPFASRLECLSCFKEPHIWEDAQETG